MDKLAKTLRDDANRIDAHIPEELDARIQASLAGIEPERPVRAARPGQSAGFWWASSLTGIAAAAAVIAVINLQRPEPPVAGQDAAPAMTIPAIKWHAETAVLTSPLQQEYEDLRSDLERAEEAVRQDIERLF